MKKPKNPFAKKCHPCAKKRAARMRRFASRKHVRRDVPNATRYYHEVVQEVWSILEESYIPSDPRFEAKAKKLVQAKKDILTHGLSTGASVKETAEAIVRHAEYNRPSEKLFRKISSWAKKSYGGAEARDPRRRRRVRRDVARTGGGYYARITERDRDVVFDVYDVHHNDVDGGRASSVHEARARIQAKYPGARVEACAMRCEVAHSRDPRKGRFGIQARPPKSRYVRGGGPEMPWTEVTWGMVQREDKPPHELMSFSSRGEAREAISLMRTFGEGWSATQYRVVEMRR